MSKYKILSVGGSIIIPKGGFNVNFLKKFRSLIVNRVKAGDKFVLVIGGGATCRAYQQAAKKTADLSDENLDWLGIYSTWFNAEFVRLFFGSLAHAEVIRNPTKKISSKKPIIVAGGWVPKCSTDRDAVLLAKNLNANEVVNLSNIDYVYNADPKKVKNAKKMPELSWNELKAIVGDKWIPGSNVPFDPMAIKEAQALNLILKFVKGTNLKQVENALSGKNFKGTLVKAR
ncbi:MAG: UMP kinase [bacterium]